MPLNSVLETKKGVVRVKSLSFSLKRSNASGVSTENHSSKQDLKENSNPNLNFLPENQENKSLKRPFKNTYLNTLNAAKKLKVIQEVAIVSEKHKTEPKLIVLGETQTRSAMLNGHTQTDNQYSGSAPAKKTPIATLSNLGNTCFLNSVLYTLRYAPRFLHNLHHLVTDLASVEQKLGNIKLKSSSLGRSAASFASSGARSFSNKDLLSLGQSDNFTGKTKIQIATERLHETYASLRAAETKCLNSSSPDATPEPFAADAFLSALREVNSTFEGNRQQDAHELLICILNNIRETCRALSVRASRLQLHENGDSNGIGRQPSPEGDSSKLSSLRKSWKKRKEPKTLERRVPIEDRSPSPVAEPLNQRAPGWDFVADDFEGTMVMRTTCMECETVRSHSQAMCDVCVPVLEDGEPDAAEPFRAAALATEYLRDQNKYWCGQCLRYVEARRAAAYARLPRLLVLQLKRFGGGLTKITKHAPTPLEMPCFCEPCAKRPPDQPSLHRYELWAVIMHLGQTLSGGHYVAYARQDGADVWRCAREVEAAGGGGLMRSLFRAPRPASSCNAHACCVPRLPAPPASPTWLACDDDLVKPITDEEFRDLLSPEPKLRSAATPYLLFYVKTEVG